MISVLKKELHRVFSDFKLIFSTFLLSPLIMVVIFSVIMFLAINGVMKIEQNVPTILVNNAPSFVTDDSKFELIRTQGESMEALAPRYASEKLDVIVSFPEGFEQSISDYKKGEAPKVVVVYDQSNEFASSAKEDFVRDYLKTFERNVIIERIGGEEFLTVFEIVDDSLKYNITEEKKLSGKMLSKFLPYFIYVFMFASAMGLIMESIAGEKERGTLTTQLLTPVSREGLALGKLTGLSVLCGVGALSQVLGIVLTGGVVMLMAPQQVLDSMSLNLSYGWMDYLYLSVLLVASVLMNVSLLMVGSALGKTIKEASAYVMPLYFAVMIVGFIPMYSPSVGEHLWEYFIPIYGQVVALSDIFAFKADPLRIGIASVIPLLVVGVMIFIIKNIFNNERMIVSE
ncbi:MAG: ABC transporter permease [Bacillota bacterium]|nr:ABC transporter permease [Bacillota bacterium]